MPITHAGPIARLRRLSGARRAAVLRAAGLLTGASIAVSLLPFRTAIQFGCVGLGRRSWSTEQCVWAVQAAARLLPWHTACIQKGLAVQRMLRGAGIEAVLHYGARHGSGGIEAHVWVTVAGRPVMGGGEAADFAAVAHYS